MRGPQNSTPVLPVITNKEDIKLELLNLGFTVTSGGTAQEMENRSYTPDIFDGVEKNNPNGGYLQDKQVTLFHYTSRALFQKKSYSTMFQL
ncbi:hypothetical protein CEXT_278161 [Caerostris extrusa]|uniref:MGS-like domain-containing protein n=1 Tax=Caerostris extrusa TaxID=172846 RepID=A0AAV4QBB5_CAEEX|nr:hypothetical protein CEXT_278161 [Caerostris extrusa]